MHNVRYEIANIRYAGKRCNDIYYIQYNVLNNYIPSGLFFGSYFCGFFFLFVFCFVDSRRRRRGRQRVTTTAIIILITIVITSVHDDVAATRVLSNLNAESKQRRRRVPGRPSPRAAAVTTRPFYIEIRLLSSSPSTVYTE